MPLVGRDSLVGIVTRYGMDCPGLNSSGDEIFRTFSDQPCFLYNGYRVSFPGVKRQGRGVNHPPPSGVQVKERVELYFSSPSGRS
jgi:hypothetical protein